MGKFVGALYLRYNHETKRWVTTKPFKYISDKGVKIEIPQGYSTDLDSVPRVPFLHAWLKGRATKSAVIHDWLYYNKHNRAEADKIFLAAMKDEGVRAWRRVPIYLAVRLFGWLAYK